MNRFRYGLPLVCAALLLALPARSCGPDFPTAIFVLTTGPDGNYAHYLQGHLGVPQSGYRTRHLVVAYDYLTQRPLSATEQKQAAQVNEDFLNPWQSDDEAAKKSAPPSGASRWLDGRNAIDLNDGVRPAEQPISRSVPGVDYNSFDNCLDDAFATAAKTLAARVTSYGAKDPSVLEWVRGQDAVFSNCGDGKPEPYYGPGKPPPPPPAPHPPAAAPASAPVWLKQDRAYQLAAAQFYALDFDRAIAGFRAIAADTGSPWSMVSRYLVARALIRKATLVGDVRPSTLLGLAQKELLAMRADPRMAPMRSAVDDLLDYVNLRLQPEAQAVTLAARLHATAPSKFGQALIDLTWLRTNRLDASQPPPPHAPYPTSADPAALDMLRWIEAVSTNNETASLQQWRATHSTAWLLAAISFAQPADAATPELLSAAAAVPRTDPAWTAVTYHRLRLLPRNAATREQLLAALPHLDKAESSSTVNLFTALNASTAPTLESWLATAARKPAAETTYGEAVPVATLRDASNDVAAPGATMPFVEDACGKKFPQNTVLPLFDTDAAVALNRDMPLRLLAVAAESNALPENLRFQVAQSAWARSVLLDRPEIARRMAPLLIACRAAWKPVLDAYNAAATPEQRHAAGLFALMRFASTEPSVREAEERRNGFATYDEYRQNWWCTTVPKAGLDVDYQPGYRGDASGGAELPAPPPPLFLTSADLAEARAEVALLEKVPNASTYFAQQALAWMKLHPQDPQTPELLGQADRVLRNSCRVERPYDSKTGQPTGDPHDPNLTANLAHALFDALHTHYPSSAWAKRYSSWE